MSLTHVLRRGVRRYAAGDYSGPAASFLESLGGCVVHVSADLNAFSDSGTTPATNSGTVEQWNDQSGNGWNFTQTTSGNRPTYFTSQVNGLPAIQFGSSAAIAMATSASLGFTSPITIVLVVRPTGFNGSYSLFCDGGNNIGQFGYAPGATSASHPFMYMGTTWTAATIIPFNVYGYATLVFNSASSEFRYNGSSIASGTGNPGNSAITSGIVLGNQANTSGTLPMPMLLAEFAIFNRALPSTEYLAVESYFRSKYALS